MCLRTCRCTPSPPHLPSDGNKGPPREPLPPHRPLARRRSVESPRHTPGTLCLSSRAPAAASAASAAAVGGPLLTGLAWRRRSASWFSAARSHTPTSRPPRLPSPRARALCVGEHSGRLGKTAEAGNRTTVLLRLFVVRFGWSLEVAEPPRKPWSQRRQPLKFLV